jgi:hypothetical protein
VERTATAHRCFITESDGCKCLCDEDWSTATSTPTTFSGSLPPHHPGHPNNQPLASAAVTAFTVEGLATLQGVTLETAQTNAFQHAFVAGLCAEIQAVMSSFQCSSISISSITSSSGSDRRLLQATSSGSITVSYTIHPPSADKAAELEDKLEDEPIAPADLVAACKKEYTGGAELGTLIATVAWVLEPTLWTTWTVHSDKACSDHNQLDLGGAGADATAPFSKADRKGITVQIAKAMCEAEPRCVSFEQLPSGLGRDGEFQFSTTCGAPGAVAGALAGDHDDHALWVIDRAAATPPLVWTVFPDKACSEHNELNNYFGDDRKGITVQTAKAMCEAKPDCVSFEMLHHAGREGEFQFSTTCGDSHTQTDYNLHSLYTIDRAAI